MMNQFGRQKVFAAVAVTALVGTASAVAQMQAPGNGAALSTHRLAVANAGGQSVLKVDGASTVRVTDAEIFDVRAIDVPETATTLVLWEEQMADGTVKDHYAISRDAGKSFPEPLNKEATYDIKLRHGEFDPGLRAAVAVEPALVAGPDCELYIVQFVVQPIDEFREKIEALGGEIYAYMPEHAHIVRMTLDVEAAVEELPYVRWVGLYHPAYRLDEPLRDGLAGTGPALGTARYHIQVFLPGAAQKNAVADRITAMGGFIDILDQDRGILFDATLTPAQLLAVANMNEVEFIDGWSPPVPTMNNVRIVGGANYVESAAGYDGTGVRAEVHDDGCQLSHPDFSGRITVRGNSITTMSHGTATFGIVFGSGAGSSNATGMMPEAFGYFNDFAIQTTRYNDIGQLNNSPFLCVFQSNSWGYQNGNSPNYVSVTADLDQAVFDHDIVILHSFGNTGDNNPVELALGKNVVGVGGVVHFDDSSLTNDRWNGTGSIGPPTDGRFKPDICFYYDSIRTTAPTSTYTSGFGGTSAACPETAGHFGLMFQMWADGIFGNPVGGGSVWVERPHSSTARALIYNTARPYPLTQFDINRFNQGWGLPNVQRLYDARDRITVIDESDILREGFTNNYTRIIEPEDDELRVTLVWNDRWGTTSSSQHRINDLNLKVVSPGGVTYWGDHGLDTSNWNTSGGSANTKDTVEHVFIQNPPIGSWSIQVTAADVNGDGHTETGTTDVDYALVMNGGTDCPVPGFDDDPDNALVCLGDDVLLSATPTNYSSVIWLKNGVPMSGENGLTLSLDNVTASDLADYSLRATNGCGDRVSQPATVAEPGPPTITSQPATSLTKCAGTSGSFSLTATGLGSLTYQWYHDDNLMPGKTSQALVINNVKPSDAGDYDCVVSSLCHSTQSNTGTLVVNGEGFADLPVDQCAGLGDTVQFHAESTMDNGEPVTWQWKKGAAYLFDDPPHITGAATNTLTITSIVASDAADYAPAFATFNPELCINTGAAATLTVSEDCSVPGDFDGDGDVDGADYDEFELCLQGPDVAAGGMCAPGDFDGDGDVDLDDASEFTLVFAP